MVKELAGNVAQLQGELDEMRQKMQRERTARIASETAKREFQDRLAEKEGLLEYQEERLLDSEDQEVQMALYINILARSVLALNLTLPEGLEEQPYYGESRARAPGDDDAQRRRRLRAVAATPATGAYREFLLAQQAARQKK